MRLRTIRNMISVGAALGLAHGGWGSCSQVLTEIGSAATRPQLASPYEGQVEGPRALLSMVGSRTRCIAQRPLVCYLAADRNWDEPALRGCSRHLAEGVPAEADSYAVGNEDSRRPFPPSARRARPHTKTVRAKPDTSCEQTRAVQIATEHASVHKQSAARVAKEQAALDRIAAERIARMQQQVNKRRAEWVVREQTAINRRGSARIAIQQEDRDRPADEWIEKHQAIANRRAMEAPSKRLEVACEIAVQVSVRAEQAWLRSAGTWAALRSSTVGPSRYGEMPLCRPAAVPSSACRVDRPVGSRRMLG